MSDRSLPADSPPSGTARKVCLGLGVLALLLMLGALGFQYLDRLPPCEMCHWQRWPLIAAIVTGLGGAAFAPRTKSGNAIFFLAGLTLLLVAISGVIGAYQAGVEWHWWAGPAACTGPRFVYSGSLDLNTPVVRCDVAAWRLLGISLAGYNAILSLGAAAIAVAALARQGSR